MKLNIYNSTQEVTERLADFFAQKVNAAIADSNECAVVLSGGNSPQRLYERLATEPYRSSIDWGRISFFLGDERYVPFDDPASNGIMAKRTLFDPLRIDPSRIFYMRTHLKPDEAARDYSKRIKSYFKERPICFDLVLLGLGDDGHTASLFPHNSVLHEQKALVSAVFVEKLQAYRITMTAAVINEAHTIAFLVLGESKAHAVKEIIDGNANTEAFPAKLIAPEEGEVEWFLDEEAAGLLDKAKAM
jgi:6-phosphogluconolactonase